MSVHHNPMTCVLLLPVREKYNIWPSNIFTPSVGSASGSVSKTPSPRHIGTDLGRIMIAITQQLFQMVNGISYLISYGIHDTITIAIPMHTRANGDSYGDALYPMKHGTRGVRDCPLWAVGPTTARMLRCCAGGQTAII